MQKTPSYLSPRDFAQFCIAFIIYVLLFGNLARLVFIKISVNPMTSSQWMGGLLKGIVFDLGLAAYLILPLLLYYAIAPARWVTRKAYIRGFYFLFNLFFGISLFSLIAEFLFMEEFQSRFNFIAVDYLIYTNEILKNIWESYPMVPLLSGILLVTVLISVMTAKRLGLKGQDEDSRGKRFAVLIIGLVIVLIFDRAVVEAQFLDGVNATEAEVSKNTLYTLFSAYRHNEIDYGRFYSTVPKANSCPKQKIQPVGPVKKLNIVLVLMESMSARYMKLFHSPDPNTSYLDELGNQGLFFSHLYSTGTRTVRGIEATTLSMPPTPGQSIVRRPGSDNLFNLGSVLRDQGYEAQFVYGGRAVFDNMRGYFESNHYQILDKTTMPKEQIHFSNAWGVCDEDLFDYSLKAADELDQKKKPFFQYILTTSNHRPYTYPAGRIDIPSHTSRGGAVKYADYSIGRYIKMASQKPWFKDTVFVFVADHNASVAGGTNIFPYDYLIPVIIYSPAHIKPQVVAKLASQVDLPPTLLGLLNMPYESRFFGQNLLDSNVQERTFLATYQKVAYWEKDHMALLAPNRWIEVSEISSQTAGQIAEIRPKKVATFQGGFDSIPPDYPYRGLIEKTIQYYQTASECFRKNELRLDSKN